MNCLISVLHCYCLSAVVAVAAVFDILSRPGYMLEHLLCILKDRLPYVCRTPIFESVDQWKLGYAQGYEDRKWNKAHDDDFRRSK
jgi:hypothetical protein